MVIISVSNSKEKAMLNTVRVLRRLLRNAFFVTNRVNVIGELQRGPGTGRRRQARPSPPRIDEEPRYLQPARARFLPRSRLSAFDKTGFTFHIFAHRSRPQVEIVIRVG